MYSNGIACNLVPILTTKMIAMAHIPSPGPRFHFLDTARALCMVLGIPYHAALIYASGVWRVTSPEESPLAELIARGSQSFRMPLFFMIAGFFAIMLIQRRGAFSWLSDRIIRLLVPLFFAAVLINPFMVAAGVWGDQSVPISDKLAAMLLKIRNPWNLIGHLWFLAALAWMCIGLAIVFAATAQIKSLSEIANRATQHRICLPVALVAVMVWEGYIMHVILNSGIPKYAAFSLINLPQIFRYVPYFVLGGLLFQNERARSVVTTVSAVSLSVGSVGLVVYLMRPALELPQGIGETVATLSALTVSWAIIGLLARFADRESAAVRTLVDRSFTIYLLHMPLIVALGAAFLYVTLPPFFEFAMISALTLVTCYWAAGIVERHWVTRFMFNGLKPKKPVLPLGGKARASAGRGQA